MTNKITFVATPNIQYDQNYGTLFAPLWAYTLAAHVPEGWDTDIADCVFEDLERIGPADVFAFSGINQDVGSIQAAHDLLKAKFPDATFILGGPITWSLEQEGKLPMLEYFDHLFILDGEQTLPDFLERHANGENSKPPKIIRAGRFPLNESRKVRIDLFKPKAHNYYGALVEVSRGCPFLCEFCDIRTLPGNNRSHNKNTDLIVEEMDAYHRLGITQFQFACDNFIGDVVWARSCVDAIIAWKESTGADVSIFAWLTINIYKMPDLMAKMRRAGFSILFLGIESVNQNSLLETAKVQNRDVLDTAVRAIQSFGFIIAPGFIFGFDSDPETIFDDTLDFISETGLIGGDPSFLMALPGTPLFKRMLRTGRLIERQEEATVRRKITTNILYLQNADSLVRGFVHFMEKYMSPKYQLRRFRNLMDMVLASEHFIPSQGKGYGSPVPYVKLQFKDPGRLKFLLMRIGYILGRPAVFLAVLRAWLIVKKASFARPGLGIHFNYWIYVWTNMGLKYEGLSEDDFTILSVDEDYDLSRLLDKETIAATAADRPRVKGETKVSHQARYTKKALDRLVESRSGGAAASQKDS